MQTLVSEPEAERHARARRLVRTALVWDNHACMPIRPHDESFLPQLERHRAAGVDVVMLNVGYGEDGIEAHVRMLATLRHWLARHGDRFRLAGSVADIHAARAAGQLAVAFDIEGANAIGDQVNLVHLYHALGVRWMLVAYNRNNRAGGGCQDDDSGLSGFGRGMVDAMNEVGMLVCCSHTGRRTARAVIDHSSAPVIFSHSNAAALKDHPRNIGDDLIRACAARGGVIGINGVSMMLGAANDNAATALAMARHIDHVVQLVGPAHAGLGIDYPFDRQEIVDTLARHPDAFPPELGYTPDMHFLPPEGVVAVADSLLALGYDDAAVSAVLGGNWMRLAGQVWRA